MLAVFFLIKMIFGGVLLCAAQALFLYLTIRIKGFVMPLIAVAAVSLINVVMSNSLIVEILSMVGGVSAGTGTLREGVSKSGW